MPRKSQKVCAVCGKEETVGWNSHWKRKHPQLIMSELSLYPSLPWCDDWFDYLSPEMQEKYEESDPKR